MKKLKPRVHACKIVDAGVDWMTATASSPSLRENLWLVARRLLETRQREGERPSAWHAHGYGGWKCSHLAFGARRDSVCLQLTSFEAEQEWRHCIGACENVSRFDLSVDTHFDPPVTTLSRKMYVDAGHTKPPNGRKPRRELRVSSDGGSTLYIGARQSEQFGRLYDKGIEQGTHEPGHWWRWEVELKGSAAWNAAGALRRIDDPRIMILLSVNSWFRSRTSHSYSVDQQQFTFVGSRRETDVDRQLQWLARGVRPTVQNLLDHVGRERVLFALGLLPQSAVNGPDQPVILKEA